MAARTMLLVLACLQLIQTEAMVLQGSTPSSGAAAIEARLLERASSGELLELSGAEADAPETELSEPASDSELERVLLKVLTDPEPTTVAAVLSQGLEALTVGIAPLLRDTTDWKEGLATLNAQFWEVVLLLVPGRYHESPRLLKAKAAWDRAFVRTQEFEWDIAAFKSSGDAGALSRAVKTMVLLAVKMSAEQVVAASSRVVPKMVEYFDGICDLIDGVSASYELYADGHVAQAAEVAWKAVRLAVDEVVGDNVTRQHTYSTVMGTVDGVMDRLAEHVQDYKHRIQHSKVCYKRTIQREKKRPNVCREDFEWDQMYTCKPKAATGANCLSPCGAAGICPSFCGRGMACCRRGDKRGPAECQGSTGFVDFAYTRGSSRDYHQCVQPGPAVAFEIKSCGEFELNGLWVKTGVKSERPRYTLADNRNAIMEWSVSRAAWRLYIDTTWLGYGRSTLYLNPSTSKTFPTSGWEEASGISPVPQIEIFGQPASASLVQESTLEGSLSGKGTPDYGTHEAMCDPDEDVEKAGHWCVSPCPVGYRVQDAHTCVQLCGGKMPADSWGMCGTSVQDVYAIVGESALTVGTGAAKGYVLIDDMKKKGVDGDRLAGTINTVVDMGKPFAHPRCPEFVALPPRRPGFAA